MSHSYCCDYQHIVFSTKYRRPTLRPEIMARLCSYLASALTNWGIKVMAIGGHRDHLHFLVRKNADRETSSLVKEIKHSAGNFLRKEELVAPGFKWQEGYGAFSISAKHVRHVTEYIRNQEEHHKAVSFEQEFQRLLEIHGFAFHPEEAFDSEPSGEAGGDP